MVPFRCFVAGCCATAALAVPTSASARPAGESGMRADAPTLETTAPRQGEIAGGPETLAALLAGGLIVVAGGTGVARRRARGATR